MAAASPITRAAFIFALALLFDATVAASAEELGQCAAFWQEAPSEADKDVSLLHVRTAVTRQLPGVRVAESSPAEASEVEGSSVPEAVSQSDLAASKQREAAFWLQLKTARDAGGTFVLLLLLGAAVAFILVMYVNRWTPQEAGTVGRENLAAAAVVAAHGVREFSSKAGHSLAPGSVARPPSPHPEEKPPSRGRAFQSPRRAAADEDSCCMDDG
mmetsp:Transcript_1015/g.2255  ORF Transcript_1015/g.2255 Transcript_1015/m.2255 type:complete len:215 (-) Transcript_1015:121-765(-)